MTALRRIVAPTVMPISLDQAKAQLRVFSNDQDDLITGYIKAATDFIDGEWGFLGRALVTQSWRVTFDSFPGSQWNSQFCNPYWQGNPSTGQIKLPLPPLQ